MEKNDKEYKKLQWLLEKLKTAEDYCEPYFDRAKRHYQLYRFASSVKEADWPYVNRVRSRDILAFIEDSTAIMVQVLFATLPFFSVIPRQTALLQQYYGMVDPMRVARQIEKSLDYQISHEGTAFLEEIVDYFKGGCIFGNSYMGVYPKFEIDRTYLRPLLKTIDFWDVLPIPGANRVQKVKGLFIREFINDDDLKEMQEKGVYKAINIKGETFHGANIKWHKELLQDVGFENYVPGEKDIEILHYFSGGHVITMANRIAVLRDSTEPVQTGTTMENEPAYGIIKPFPYDHPIVQYKYMPVPGEFFAMGIPEVLEVLQEDKNLIRSARRDNVDLTINKVLKARAGADINFDLIKYYPSAIWPLENMGDIETVDIGDVTQSSYLEEDKIRFDMENALSFFGYARGMTPAHTERPTTVARLQQASMNRQDLAIKVAEFGVLQHIAMRIVLLTRKYMSQSDYEAIIGEKDAGFYLLPEEYIKRFYYIKPVGSSVTHIKEVRQQQVQFALQLLSNVRPDMLQNQFDPFAINWYQALHEALETADVKNVDRILIRLQQQQQAQSMPSQGILEALKQIQYGGNL